MAFCDPVLREGVEGMVRRLRAAAEEMAEGADSRGPVVSAGKHVGQERAGSRVVLVRGTDDLCASVLALLRAHPAGLNTRAVRAAIRARDTDVDTALRRLKAEGKATCVPGPRRALIWRADGSRSGLGPEVRPECGPAPGHGGVEEGAR